MKGDPELGVRARPHSELTGQRVAVNELDSRPDEANFVPETVHPPA